MLRRRVARNRRSSTGAETRPDNNPNMETKKIGLAIHGGAGTIERSIDDAGKRA